MRARILCSAAAALALSCVKRINPDPGGDRTTYSGVPLQFGRKQDLPQGTTISWNYGDGTPEQTGAQVTHAFPRAGVFTVVETVRDKDGQTRTARTHVAALRRAVAMAVPADARAALIVERPWQKLKIHREVASKLSLGGLFDELFRAISEGAGFEVLDASTADANGFDPDEGFAMFTLPQDREALVFAIGTSDETRALAAARRLLTSPQAPGRVARSGPYELIEQRLQDGTPVIVGTNQAGDKIGVTHKLGYLYVRTPGSSDPLLALRAAADLPPDRGLAADETFRRAVAQTGAGDAIFYSRPGGRDGRFSNELGATAFSMQDHPDLVQMRAWSQLKNIQGDALQAAFKPARPPPDIAARFPSGAAAYARISAAPTALWREIARASGADAARVRDRVYELTGLDVERELLPHFTGNVGIGVYLDATSLVEAILGEQVGSFDRSAFLVVAELSAQDAIVSALDRALKGRPARDRARVAGASYYRLGDGARAAIKEGFFYLSIGGTPPREPDAQVSTNRQRKKAAAPAPPSLGDLGVLGQALAGASNSLSRELKAARLAGFDVPGQQDVWVDLGGIARSVERAASEQGGAVGQGAHLFAERAGALRDALFETRPSKDGSGMDAELWVRFQSRRSAQR